MAPPSVTAITNPNQSLSKVKQSVGAVRSNSLDGSNCLKSCPHIPDIRDRLLLVLNDGQTYPHHNLYYVHSTLWDMEVLGSLLLSEVAQFFVECYAVRIRGGYLRFQAQYLRRIRVPRPQDIPAGHAARLVDAFRRRDVELATDVALDLYGIDRHAITTPTIMGDGVL